VTGAAHAPAGDGEPARTYLRLEGFESSVRHRSELLRAALAGFGPADVLSRGTSQSLWLTILDVDALSAPFETPLWRISVPPSAGPKVVAEVSHAFPARVLYDWGGGLVWIAGGDGDDAGAAVVRKAVAGAGGHATLVRADDQVRNSVAVYQPLAAPLMELTRRLKATFDPAGILNPGRMYAGV
jgi:glycolate oxidase FAD binding subunit